MAESIFDEDEGGFTFSDADFERRYYSSEQNIRPTSGSVRAVPVANSQVAAGGARGRGSRNRFMRTLIRRRLLSAVS